MQPVGQKAANELGLYDMSGNVWEWCSDYFGDYSVGSVSNPIGPTSGELRVLRGGSWGHPAAASRVSARGTGFPNASGGFPNGFIGFRLAINTFDPEIETTEIEAITDSSASVVFEVSSLGRNGIAEMGIVWGPEADPVLSDHANVVVADYVSKGSFTLPLAGLSPYTPYYVRAYARNDQETVYGQTLKFQTLQAIPEVVTQSLLDIYVNGVRVSGEILADHGAPILMQGIALSTEPSPDLSDIVVLADTINAAFEVATDQLSPLTKYYARAFAQNAIGVAYGEEISFVTPMDFSGVSMVMVPGGTFLMGCDTGDCDSDEHPVHEVTLDTFFMAQFEVTQDQWYEYTGQKPSNFKNCGDCPVEKVSWDLLDDFLAALNAKTGYSFRLPTEAEWEYAALGGLESEGYSLAGSNMADSVAWYLDNAGSVTHPVGQKRPNELGLYDMTGNVAEWCNDDYVNYYSSDAALNPDVFVRDDYRFKVIRGASWYTDKNNLRLSNRNNYRRNLSHQTIGLRLARSKVSRTPVAPTVATLGWDSITAYTAIVQGSVLDDGGSEILERGFVWSTSSNPDLSDNKIVEPNMDSGEFTLQLSGLTTETNYYVKAYAINAVDTVFGEQLRFETDWDYSLDMVLVEGGTFIMGCSGNNCEVTESKQKYKVNLDGFYIARFEFTQKHWEKIMGSNPSLSPCGADCPVNYVNWNEVKRLIERLNELSGLNYRLPTEAEWEFAARGGNESRGYRFSGSNSVYDVAWINTSSLRKGGLKLPNELGIYDMSGNVAEWCSDWSADLTPNEVTNPTGPPSGKYKIIRGGAYNDRDIAEANVSTRYNSAAGFRSPSFGFRLVLSLEGGN